jgi:hypothetical protein
VAIASQDFQFGTSNVYICRQGTASRPSYLFKLATGRLLSMNSLNCCIVWISSRSASPFSQVRQQINRSVLSG